MGNIKPDRLTCKACSTPLIRYDKMTRFDSLGNARCIFCHETYIPLDDLVRRQKLEIAVLTDLLEWYKKEK